MTTPHVGSTRYMVIVHVIDTSGVASRRSVRQFFILASSEREAWRKVKDILRNRRLDVDGVPEIRRAEPGDATLGPQQRRHEPTRQGFYHEPDVGQDVEDLGDPEA